MRRHNAKFSLPDKQVWLLRIRRVNEGCFLLANRVAFFLSVLQTFFCYYFKLLPPPPLTYSHPSSCFQYSTLPGITAICGILHAPHINPETYITCTKILRHLWIKQSGDRHFYIWGGAKVKVSERQPNLLTHSCSPQHVGSSVTSLQITSLVSHLFMAQIEISRPQGCHSLQRLRCPCGGGESHMKACLAPTQAGGLASFISEGALSAHGHIHTHTRKNS